MPRLQLTVATTMVLALAQTAAGQGCVCTMQYSPQAVPIHGQQQQQQQKQQEQSKQQQQQPHEEARPGAGAAAAGAPAAAAAGPPPSWTLAPRGDCGCPPAYEPVCVGGVTFANACTAACGRRRAAMAYNGPCVEQAAPAMQPASNSVSMQRGGRWGLGWLCLLLSPLAVLLNSYD
ncbi:hypothetical protein OEZ86_005099 [Tetradesmus obliquus]|nr:hypothetical protein OEZ86_005099 [Tetradesmus obliquus]